MMLDCHGGDLTVQSTHTEEEIEVMKGNDDMDPWPYTGWPREHSLGDVREALANRVFAPLFGGTD